MLPALLEQPCLWARRGLGSFGFQARAPFGARLGESPQASCREARGWEGEVGLASKQSEKPWGSIGLLLSSEAALPQLISCPGPNPGPALSHPSRLHSVPSITKVRKQEKKAGPCGFLFGFANHLWSEKWGPQMGTPEE